MLHNIRGTIFVPALLVAALVTSCSKMPGPSPEQVYTKIDPATAGSVSGTIHFKDVAPTSRIAIDMSQDPACGLSATGPNLSEKIVVSHGDLQNVYLYIKSSGLGSRVYAAPTTPVVLDQKGCRYVPHVLAVMVGQPIEVHNSDMTMHNVHPEPNIAGNHESDITQGPHGDPVKISFHKPETMVSFRCNNHPWMEAFVNVAENPFYAVSDGDGHYEIHGLPPGSYTLVAVHEKLGKKEAEITVASNATATADFTFQGQ